MSAESYSNCSKTPLFFSEQMVVTRAAINSLPKLYREIYEFLAEVGDVEIIEEETQS